MQLFYGGALLIVFKPNKYRTHTFFIWITLPTWIFCLLLLVIQWSYINIRPFLMPILHIHQYGSHCALLQIYLENQSSKLVMLLWPLKSHWPYGAKMWLRVGSYNFVIHCNFLKLFVKLDKHLSIWEYNFYFNWCLGAKVMAQ